MLRFKLQDALLLWLAGLFLASQIVLATIDDYFKVSFSESVTGTCAAYDSDLDTFMDDVVTLAEYASEAVKYAQMELDQLSAEDEKKALVARKLFTAYFGIEFDGSAPTEATEDDWDTLTTNIETYETYIETKDYPTKKNSPHLFCKSYGQWFQWSAQALGSDGKGLSDTDGNGLSISDIYSYEYTEGKTNPYWVPAMNNYIFMPSAVPDDVCDYIPPKSEGKILGLCVQGNKQQIEAVDGSDTPVKELSSPENVLLCPSAFDDSNPLQPYNSLDDVESAATEAIEGDGLGGGVQLSVILPRSASLYHEIWHMVTFWYDSGKEIRDAGSEFVGDVTYDLGEVLNLGTEGIVNAQSYMYFAVAYWFYASRTDWGTEVAGTFFTETFEPWTYI
ncbi:hypothetical protein N7456_001124 [Penicillium angulare]|uniref:Lysine-specific metallo-endopeptidase domain-containing protein n=1 Tax=Penicillium angulare TaxID=116970 RepID=A0A9W9KT01_9EURO|nr:hypothetical protein N7456_001124 [Penicillium angulare]